MMSLNLMLGARRDLRRGVRLRNRVPIPLEFHLIVKMEFWERIDVVVGCGVGVNRRTREKW
jgi:hypothetical protein